MQDLWTNKILIRREASHGGVLAATVVKARLAQAVVGRKTAGAQVRQDPYGTTEFSDIVHDAWELDLRGEATSGEFLIWLLGEIAEAGTPERAMAAWELAEEARPPTFAIQAQEIDGTDHTYTAAALQALSLTIKGRAIIGWAARFMACRLDTTAPTWTATHEDAGEIMAGHDAGVAVASAFTSGVAPTKTDTFEASLEISLEGGGPVRFGPDGYATAHQGGTWDLVGQILVPETAGLTDVAIGETFPGDLAIWWSSGIGNRLEIQAGVTLAVEQRLLVSQEWRQAACAFVSRRGPGFPVAKIFHQGDVFS